MPQVQLVARIALVPVARIAPIMKRHFFLSYHKALVQLAQMQYAA